ncbi:MAG: hypothetical protein O3C44_10420 [Proteobacteria bacterium]|nr:hypothetical protein [Pseudomonadota bacterium]
MTRRFSIVSLLALTTFFLFAGPASPFLAAIISMIGVIGMRAAFRRLSKKFSQKPMLTNKCSNTRTLAEAHTNAAVLKRANELKQRISRIRRLSIADSQT